MLAMLAMFRNPQGTKQGTFPPWNGIRRWLLHRLVRRFIRHGASGALRICWDSGKDNRWSRAISLQGFDLLTENRRGLVVRNLSRSHCSIAFSDSSTGRSVP